MYKIRHTTAKIEVKNYISNYRDTVRFIEYCKKCNRYNTCWSCPPFDFDEDKYISDLDTAYIIGTQILIEKHIITENKGLNRCETVLYEIIDKVRLELDKTLLDIETKYPASRVFFAGTCRNCMLECCTRAKGNPCINPHTVRPSLEALGFDISKTSSELLNIEMKWSVDGDLPEYLTLVSGFFMKASHVKESNTLHFISDVLESVK